MTKVIYVDWRNRIIVASEEDKEQWVDDWIESNYYLYNFAEWLEAHYEPITLYNMTAEEKAKLPAEYEEYLKNEKRLYREKAEKAFKEDFEAFVI